MFDFEKRLTEIGQQTILCIGDLMLDDFVYGDVSRISPEAPAPVIRVSREDVIVGGAGNVARNIASLGAKCLFVGVIGDDVAGTILQRGVEPERGARSSRISWSIARVRRRGSCASSPSIIPTHLLRADWELTQPLDAKTEAALIKQALALLPQASAVVLSDYAKGVLTPKAHPHGDRAREEARQAGCRRSQGQRFLDLSRRHRHHAEPEGTGRGDASAGGYRQRRSRRRQRCWPARSAARRCW